MERIERERFDLEKCRAELLCNLKNDFLALLGLAASIILPLIVTTLLFAIALRPGTTAIILGSITAVFWLLPIAILIGAVIFGIKTRSWIKNTSFFIVEDTLSNAHEIATEIKNRRRGAFADPHFTYHWEFYFSEHGMYKTTQKIAPWSKSYCMTSKDLYRSSSPGDKFYLLLGEQSKKGEKPNIILVYPCKYFQWQGETA